MVRLRLERLVWLGPETRPIHYSGPQAIYYFVELHEKIPLTPQAKTPRRRGEGRNLPPLAPVLRREG